VCEATSACIDGADAVIGTLNVNDCEASCADARVRDELAACRDEILDGACDPEGLERCTLTLRAPTCVTACDTRSACDANYDEPSCFSRCTTTPSTLAQMRWAAHDTCLATAATCVEADVCNRLANGPVAEAERICGAEACNRIDPNNCAARVTQTLRGSSSPDATASCIENSNEICDRSIHSCVRVGQPRDGTCAATCGELEICGLLEGRDTVADCQARCAAGGTGPNSEHEAESLLLGRCAGNATCAQLETCLDGGVAAFCDGECNTNVNCGLGWTDAAACTVECTAHFGAQRWQSIFMCARMTRGDCNSRGACYGAPSPDCDRVCAHLEACGVNQADCVRTCDNAAWRSPTDYQYMLGCVAQAEQCADRIECLAAPRPGDRCAAWCSPGQRCQFGEGLWNDCIEACGTGLNPDAEVLYYQNRDCLAQSGAEVQCPEGNLCPRILVVNDSYCAHACELVTACGGNDPTCLSTCRGNFNLFAYQSRVAPLFRAERRGEPCEPALEVYNRPQ
jgi:hypothetical protein